MVLNTTAPKDIILPHTQVWPLLYRKPALHVGQEGEALETSKNLIWESVGQLSCCFLTKSRDPASCATASTSRTLIKVSATVFFLHAMWQTFYWNSLNLATHLYNRPLCSLVRFSSPLRNSWSVNKSKSRPSKNGLKKVTGLLLPLATDCSRTKPTALSETSQETMKRPCLSGSFKVTEDNSI